MPVYLGLYRQKALAADLRVPSNIPFVTEVIETPTLFRIYLSARELTPGNNGS